MSFLTVSGIWVKEEETTILQDISFEQQEFRNLAIAGETGSGKSTLLQTIAGLIQPSAGSVVFDGNLVEGPHDKLVPGHPGIAYLSQHFELPQFLRVEQVLRYTNTLSDSDANKLYEICHISHLVKRKTNQLSGGERQRIALARLLSSWPDLLLLDEPYSNLDISHKSVLKAVINNIGDQLGITCILISHDPADTLSWADEIVVMKDGRMVQQGTPEQIYRTPTDMYTAGLFGNYNLIAPQDAALFTEALGIAYTTKSLLIRPENLHLSENTNYSVQAEVQKTTYYGAYYEVQAKLGSSVVTLKTANNNLSPGQQINLTIATENISYL
jgi:ABC-type sugar transport system ATPase subunit